MPLGEKEMTEEDEMAEVRRREKELQDGKTAPLADAEFWRQVDAELQ
jgi:hypothetical protein